MFDQLIKGEAFLARTRQFLAPKLRPGDIVIADRLDSHKSEAARTGNTLWRAVGQCTN